MCTSLRRTSQSDTSSATSKLAMRGVMFTRSHENSRTTVVAVMILLLAVVSSCRTRMSAGTADETGRVRQSGGFVLDSERQSAITAAATLWSAHIRRDSLGLLASSVGRQPLEFLSRFWASPEDGRTDRSLRELTWIARYAPASDSVRAYFALPYAACEGSTEPAIIGFIFRPSRAWRIERVMSISGC
jgi:hypothetical protein